MKDPVDDRSPDRQEKATLQEQPRWADLRRARPDRIRAIGHLFRPSGQLLGLVRSHGPEMALVCLAALGVALLIYATKWGPGLSPDSASYIAGAIGIAAGHGYSFPVGGGEWAVTATWPPGYSLAMAIPIALGADPLAAARWLNALLLGANTILVGLLFRRITGLPAAIPVVGAAFFLLNRDTVITHGWAWSEALFLSLGLAGLHLLVAFLEAGHGQMLVASAGLIGAAVLTRYAGISFLLTSVLMIAFYPRGELRFPFTRRIALFGAISLMPISIWLFRNAVRTGSLFGSGPSPSPIPGDEWMNVYRTLALWFVPGRIGEPFRGLIMLLVGAALLLSAIVLLRSRATSRHAAAGTSAIGLIGWVLLVVYTLTLLFARLLLRKYPLDDPKFLLPLFPAVMVVLASAVYLAWSQLASRLRVSRLLRLSVLPALSIYLTIMLIAHARHSWQWIVRARDRGLGYNSASWRTSAFLKEVQALPADSPIYSNAYDAVFLLTSREVFPLPRKLETPLMDDSLPLPEDWQAMLDKLRTQGGVIAYFARPTRSGMADEEDLLSTSLLCPGLQTREGMFYYLCE